MTSDTLIIVESNGKCKKIESLTGHACKASFGHVYGLSPTLKWFDPSNIEPNYIVLQNKIKYINDLKKAAKKAKKIYIASDLDREGEAIAANVMDLLDLNINTTDRITFNQITKKSLSEALENPKRLDIDLYNAQKARSIIDLLFGFMCSPHISKHLHILGLSAGRCQSPTIRLINEREKEQKLGKVELFVEGQTRIKSNLVKVTHLKPKIAEENINNWLENLKTQEFLVKDKSKKNKFENPSSPLTTSTLQQMAYNKHGFNTKSTMQIAQKLYETGYITYMRTDSVTLSSDFQEQATEFINKMFGEKYSSPRQYSKKKGVVTQEAHEAIRPIDIYKQLPRDTEEQKLYKLVWLTSIRSQMTKASYIEHKLSLQTNRNTTKDFWETLEKNLVFPGYLLLSNFSLNFSDTDVENQYNTLLDKNTNIFENISNNMNLPISFISVREKSKTPPCPYNVASLVKALEKESVGRPSTYSNIVERIIEKGYVIIGENPILDIELNKWEMNYEKEISNTTYKQKVGGQRNVYLLTELGKKFCNFVENSPIEAIVNIKFTAKFEEKLDLVANGLLDWKELVKKFYTDLDNNLKKNPPPKMIKNQNNFLRILEENDEHILGIMKSKFGFYLGLKNRNENGTQTASLFPKSNINDITIEEAKFMFQLPKKFKNNEILLKCGMYGWYLNLPKDNKNIPLHNERRIPSDEEIEDALKNKNKDNNSGILEQISENWSLRQKNKSYYLMYKKNKFVKFYPVSEKLFNETEIWNIDICEKIKNKKNKV